MKGEILTGKVFFFFSDEVVWNTCLDCLFPGVFEEISVLIRILQTVEISRRFLKHL